MGKINSDIFKAYDIRGVFGIDFDEDFAARLGLTLARYWASDQIVVGRDGRPSSAGIASAVIQGARKVGVEVLDIGQCTTPLFDFVARQHGGGVMVTASHNPGDYNGFKCVSPRGEVVTGVELQEMIGSEPGPTATTTTGQVRDYTTAALSEYHQAIKKVAGISDPAWLHLSDGLTAQFDTDGDRIMISENGVAIPSDQIVGLLATQIPELRPVAHDLLFSRGVRESLASQQIGLFESATGRPALWRTMHEHQTGLGGEISGHIYFRSFGNFECPELVLVYLDRIRRSTGQTLFDLTAPMRSWVRSEPISLPMVGDQQMVELKSKIKNKYADGQIKELDGISIDYPDWWFNVRPSNTEPILRLTIEAKENDLLKEKVAELRALL